VGIVGSQEGKPLKGARFVHTGFQLGKKEVTRVSKKLLRSLRKSWIVGLGRGSGSENLKLGNSS